MVNMRPYTLEKFNVTENTVDDDGYPIDIEDTWSFVCKCRDQTGNGRQIRSASGDNVVYNAVIHCPKGIELKQGDRIRVLDKDGSIRLDSNIIVIRHEIMHSRIWV